MEGNKLLKRIVEIRIFSLSLSAGFGLFGRKLL